MDSLLSFPAQQWVACQDLPLRRDTSQGYFSRRRVPAAMDSQKSYLGNIKDRFRYITFKTQTTDSSGNKEEPIHTQIPLSSLESKEFLFEPHDSMAGSPWEFCLTLFSVLKLRCLLPLNLVQPPSYLLSNFLNHCFISINTLLLPFHGCSVSLHPRPAVLISSVTDYLHRVPSSPRKGFMKIDYQGRPLRAPKSEEVPHKRWRR